MQWLQDLNQSNVDNLNTVRHEAVRHFMHKTKEYLKAKFDELETNISKISEMCLGASVTLRRVTNPELIHKRMRRVI